MSVWDAVASRVKMTDPVESPEGRAFWHLVGLVEGFGQTLSEESVGGVRIVGDTLALLMMDALDYYTMQVDQPPF